MFNRETILKTLNSENYYIDKHSLDLFLNDWKIDSIYEDESGLEFYDDLSLDKIKRGISLKAQGYSDDQIVVKLQRMTAKVDKKDNNSVETVVIKDYDMPIDDNSNEESKSELMEIKNGQTEYSLADIPPQKSFTLDVTSQTLQMLAEAVAKKISDDIANSDVMTAKLIEAGGYKRDNEILANQIKDLLEKNKALSSRIEQLENHTSKNFWKRVWGK